MFIVAWIVAIFFTVILAQKKHYSAIGFFILAVVFGPLMLVIALILPANNEGQVLSKKINSLADAQSELISVKNILVAAQDRLMRLEKKISELAAEAIGSRESLLASDTQTEKAVLADVSGSKETAKPAESFEAVFGKYWLNRIGVFVFVLGVIFFISYTFKYLNAAAKISVGYFFAVGFFIWGNALEKREQYKKIAWGILGGAWGLLYLSTYALHYIDVTRLIDSSVIGLTLLMAVSFSAVIYNLKYRSWIVASIAYLLAFVTAGVGGLEYSTIVYCAFLVSSIVYLSCKFEWYQFLLYGVGATYVTFCYWIQPQIFSSCLIARHTSIPIYQFQLGFGILFLSWVLFSLAFVLFKPGDKERLRYIVSGTLVNAVFFTFLGLKEVVGVEPHLVIAWDARLGFLFGLSFLYLILVYWHYCRGNIKLIVSNVCIVFSLLAMAAIIKFPQLSVGFFWALEMLAIFILGVYYREPAYRAGAAVLGALVVMRLFLIDLYSGKIYNILGFGIQHNIVIFVFVAACFYIIGALVGHGRMKDIFREEEKIVYRAYTVAASVLLVFLLGREVRPKWLSLAWALEGMAVLTAGFLLGNKTYRLCALGVLSLTCLKLIFVDMAGINTIYKIIAFIFLGAVFLAASFVYSKFMAKIEAK